MNVNIKRARLIEFDWPDYQGQQTTPRITAMRNARGDAFDFLAIDGVVVGDEYSDCICEGDLAARAKNIVVFAEFPLSLADLIPEGCTRFEFRNTRGLTGYAKRCPETRRWDITQFYRQSENTNAYFSLDDAQKHFGVDLDTVVPLVADPQYVEERR